MLKYRLITGPILIIGFLALIWLDEWLAGATSTPDWLPPGAIIATLTIIAIGLACIELATVIRAQLMRASALLLFLAAAPLVLAAWLIPDTWSTSAVIGVTLTGPFLAFCLGLLFFTRGQNVQGVMASVGAAMFCGTYLGGMMAFYLLLRQEHSAWWLVGIIMTTKMCDTGAYFTGLSIGKNKLIPWLSPGKTWEGLAGGVTTSALVGVLFAWLSTFLPHASDHLELWHGAVAGVVFGVFGQLGDLIMSLLKRGANLKDSSSLLPGLGGIMDVLDSPLLVAPIAFWLLHVVLGG